ncbi:MAG: macro domain-containing protein [Bdellovibrionales bacterium]|nr:macro domain-containing protein [Bdellovibrionales bacterium]
MIHEVSGDILLTKAHAVAHGVAPNDSFNHGLALALRERWPAMYNDFRHYCHTKHPECGGLWTWGGPGHVRIVNLFTQEAAYDRGAKPGKATLSHVNHCLKALRKEVEAEEFESLAIPKLATGVGGLDWDEVKPLLYDVLGALKIPVYVYATYHAGQAAHEAK